MDSGNSLDIEQFSGKHVVAVPYPGRGHVNPMINLCNLLAARGLLITFVVTEEWFGFISSGGSSPAPAPNVRLRSIPNVIPSELVRGADFSSFVEAVCQNMGAPVERLLAQLELPVSVMVADTYLTWAVEIGSRWNIPVASLWTMAPAVFSFCHHFDVVVLNGDFPVDLLERGEERVDYIPGISSIRIADFPSVAPTKEARQVLNRALQAFSNLHRAHCLLFTCFYELESKGIDSLRSSLPFPIYPIGPSIPVISLQKMLSRSTDKPSEDYFDWLSSQPKSSVLYVSLGSFLLVSTAQMDEIAAGLFMSGVHFLWVARGEASRLQEASGEKGLVVSWCEQLRVLCHRSIGGFLTHCGWNSILEGIFAGVPMLTFPLVWDQMLDSKLIVEDWRVGLRLRSKVGVGDLVERGEIAKAVERLMDLDGEESKEMRRRARELKEACVGALEKGGSSYSNLDAFVKDFCG